MPVHHFRCLRKNAKPWKKKLAAKMSRNQTWPEKILWARLRLFKNPRFRKQSILMGYIADFWCPSAGLVIEVDGSVHLTRKSYDANRDAVLLQKGIQTMRFTASEVNTNPAAVVALIMNRVKNRLK